MQCRFSAKKKQRDFFGAILHSFVPAMKYLTKEQQKVLCVIVFLLLVGLAVKTWRTAHPPQAPARAAK